MKLVYRILLHLSWALSLLLAAWAVLFYFTLIDEINDCLLYKSPSPRDA